MGSDPMNLKNRQSREWLCLFFVVSCGIDSSAAGSEMDTSVLRIS